MLQLFRNLLKSKIGAIVALAFLVLIALAFASADVTGSGSFGGVAGGDRVATVGKARIDTSTLSQATTSTLENIKQQDPKASMKGFLAQDGLDRVLDQLIERTALREFGRSIGIVASDRLIDSEIAKSESYRGPDGTFSETAFRQALRQRGISESLVRDDIAQGLVAQQIMAPAQFGARAPNYIAQRYADMQREHRTGAIALLPSALFIPKDKPTDAQLQAFYGKNKDRFIRPERRVIRFAQFDDSVLKGLAEPTDKELAARYEANKALYAAREERKVTQVIVPTEAAAKAILAEVGKGMALEKAAGSKGLAAASLGSVTREKLASEASKSVADAAFATASGKLAAPAQSRLGWHVMRIDGVTSTPERPLASVRGELVADLMQAKRRAAINDLSARIEEEFDEGGTLADAAKDLGVTVTTTGSLTADGRLYDKPGETAPPVLAKVLTTAFAMEQEGEPQLAEIEAGKTFLIFDVSDISPSAAAPLAEIRDDVESVWKLEQASDAAKKAADAVLAELAKGKPLTEAVKVAKAPLPPVDRVSVGRQELDALQGRVPAPIALLFSMAKGTAKKLAVPEKQGWYVVSLADVVPGKVDPKDPMIGQAVLGIGQLMGSEYADAMRRAVSAEVGVKKNPAGIAAVRTQLNGGN